MRLLLPPALSPELRTLTVHTLGHLGSGIGLIIGVTATGGVVGVKTASTDADGVVALRPWHGFSARSVDASGD